MMYTTLAVPSKYTLVLSPLTCMTFLSTTLGLQGLKAFLAYSIQAMQEGAPGYPIIDQGVHTHACHHALTWPAGQLAMAYMGLG